ncbi:AI-2E family transporter [Mammaliicoccus stepanovicii]|uniref:Membrane protein n=1 Tax=Mammaliicoccus stepanovicii TaxID=643214 RepID=A0A239ZSB3_9STAP|nr:AI-2E family transporter [Mammaliicoccus stepanovicii]PNZ77095.1 AI-2E family transporter [Mammaliicoccus stepanovicii]GGI38809.1 AI-2E family transporter [Mammaliicoccus stepanovicii]SNV73907.1 membrane protein [Mammaliicoccus stepanovicii]
MLNKAWFRTGIAILLTFLIIKVFIEINHIFYPIIIIVQSILLPLLLGGFLFYICLPFQKMLEKRKIPRWGSISIIVVALILVISIFISIVAPVLTDQINNLIKNSPYIQREFQHAVDYALQQRDRLPENISQKINDSISSISGIMTNMLSNMFSYISSIVSTLFLLILVPFFLIYMLKDHEKFIPFIAKPFKGRTKWFVVNLFKDINHTLQSYIQGQVTVSLILGVLLYLGYTLVGLDYALLLALLALITNMIPFLGPWLAFLPAAIIALIQDPMMLVWVSIITLICQQLEGNVITPNVMGKSLNVHPLTIITVILAAGNLGGFVAILVAVPTYAVIKTIVRNVYTHRQSISSTASRTVADDPRTDNNLK